MTGKNPLLPYYRWIVIAAILACGGWFVMAGLRGNGRPADIFGFMKTKPYQDSYARADRGGENLPLPPGLWRAPDGTQYQEWRECIGERCGPWRAGPAPLSKSRPHGADADRNEKKDGI
jgi:hypothetical protein